ncbi:MAG: HepT-like ribonuclease domain-containing protein [Vicinamibacterales bacterium]
MARQPWPHSPLRDADGAPGCGGGSNCQGVCDAGSTFDELADRGAIPRTLADQLREGVGLRNRIAHGYALLDYRRVRHEALAGIPSIRAFLAAVGREAGV